MSSEGGGFYGTFFVSCVICVGAFVSGGGFIVRGLMKVLMGVVDAIFVKVHFCFCFCVDRMVL